MLMGLSHDFMRFVNSIELYDFNDDDSI